MNPAGHFLYLFYLPCHVGTLLAQSSFPDAGLQDDGHQPIAEGGLVIEEEASSSDSVLPLFYLGVRQEAASRPGEAVETYRRVLEMRPDLSLAIRASTLLAELSREREALQLMREFLVDNPDRADARVAFFKLGERIVKARGGDDDLSAELQDQVRIAFNKFPDHAGILNHYLSSTLAQKGSRAAGEILDEAADRDIPRGDYWLTIAQIAPRIWPIQPGPDRKANLRRVNELYEKALQHAERAPKPERIRSLTGKYFLDSRQFDRAQVVLEKLVAERPELVAPQQDLLKVYDSLGLQIDRVAAYERLLLVHPGRMDLWRRLQEAAVEQKVLPKAIQAVETLIVGGEDGIKEYSDLIRYHGELDQAEEVLQGARRALRAHPESGAAKRLLFRGLVGAGQVEESEKLLVDLMQMELEEDGGECQLRFGYGAYYAEYGHSEAAERQLRKAIEVTPPGDDALMAQLLNYLGYHFLEERRNIDEAGKMISEANRLQPNVYPFVDSLGWYHFLRENYEEALRELLRSAQLMEAERGGKVDPADAEIYDHIGQTYFKMGMLDKAVEFLGKAARTNPDDEKVAERLSDYEREAGRRKETAAPKED